MENWRDRIDGEIKRLGMSNERVAEALGLSRETVRSYRRGTSDPTAPALVALARLTGRSVEWLVTGREPAPGLTDDEQTVLSVVRALGLSRDEAIRRLAGPGTPATEPLPRKLAGSVDLSEYTSKRVARHLEQQQHTGRAQDPDQDVGDPD